MRFSALLCVTGGVLLFVSGCARTPAEKEARYLKHGKDQMEKKDYSRAILDFRNAAQVMPKDAEAYYQLAMAYLMTNDLRSGIAFLRKATELNPKHVEAQVQLARLMAGAGSKDVVEDAAKRAKEVLALAPDNIEALDTLATAELRLGQTEDALTQLEAASKRFPAHLQTALIVARAKIAAKDIAGAEAALKKVTTAAPQEVAPALVLAQFYMLVGRLPEAEAQIRRALELNPKSISALLALGALQSGSGKTDDALKTFEKVAGLGDPKYWHVHAAYLASKGRWAEALPEFEKLSNENRNDRQARSRLVSAYLAMNKVDDARKTLTAALKANPKDGDALVMLADLDLRAGKVDDAAAGLDRAVHLNADSPLVHFYMARVAEIKDQPKVKRKELEETLRLRPDMLVARTGLAMEMIRTNDAKGALQLLDKASQQQKTSPAWLVARNWALMATNDLDTVERELNSNAMVAGIAELQLQRALIAMDRKNYALAQTSAEKALSGLPGDVRVLDILVQSYAMRGQVNTGINVLRAYADKGKPSPDVQRLLATWLIKSGNAPEAHKVVAAARRTFPDDASLAYLSATLDLAENNPSGAEQTLQPLMAKGNDTEAVHMLLAQAAEKKGNRAVAIEHYRFCVAKNSANAMAANNLAYMIARDNPAEALKFAQLAVQAAPDNPAFQDTLGWVLYRNGSMKEAVTHLEEAVAKQKTAVRVYHLGMAYTKSGQAERGGKAIETALKMDPKVLESADAR